MIDPPFPPRRPFGQTEESRAGSELPPDDELETTGFVDDSWPAAEIDDGDRDRSHP